MELDRSGMRSRSRSRSRGARASSASGPPNGGSSRPSSGSRVLQFGRNMGRTYDYIFQYEFGYCRWAMSVPNPSGPLRDFARWSRRRLVRQSGGEAESEDSDSGASTASSSPSAPSGTGGSAEARVRAMQGSNPSVVGDASLEAQRRSLEANVWNLQRSVAYFVAGSSTRLGSAQRAPLRQPQAALVLENLPRVTYDPRLFGPSRAHPESCPVCMEDFAPPSRVESAAGASGGAAVPRGGGTDGGDVAESGEDACASSQEETATSMEIVMTPCLHVFHSKCLGSWMAKSLDCPSCRWNLADMGVQEAIGSSRRAGAPPAPIVAAREGAFEPDTVVDVSDDSQPG